jgi:antitoxin PrlF
LAMSRAAAEFAPKGGGGAMKVSWPVSADRSRLNLMPRQWKQMVEMPLVIPYLRPVLPEGRRMNAVTVKGQVTIPKAIRDALDIRPGSLVEFTVNGAGEIVLRKADAGQAAPHRFDRLVGILGSGMTTDEVMALTRGED